MKHLSIIFLSLLILIPAISFTSCNGGKGTGDALLSRMDSLQNLADTKSQQYEDLSMFMNTISQSLDSVAYAENMLMVAANPENGQASRETIKLRVNQFSQILARQKQRIAALTDSLSSRKNKGGADTEQLRKLNGIIDFLNLQLAAKDKELKNLQSQLASSKITVAQLTKSVTTLQNNVSTLETNNEKLGEALETQDKIINEGYIKSGTKKELEAAGIITKGGLFKKRKVNYSSFSSGVFQRIDIRHITSFTVNGKKAKLLTPAPSGSYTLTQSQKGKWLLNITNPSAFWSVSNYCVIQTD